MVAQASDLLRRLPAQLKEVAAMSTMKYTYWQDEEMWLGYLEEFPDYWTQGETRQELEENLRDILQELTSGSIPCVRRVAELQIA
jgi:hypothetical protein